MAILILAPTAAGKTDIVSRQWGGADLTDGDDVIARNGGWPKERRFWEGPNAPLHQARIGATMENWISRKKNAFRIVLFNGHPAFLPSAWSVVLPPNDILERNLAGKRAKGVTNQPLTLKEALANREALRKHALENDLPTFSSLEDAITSARSYLAKRR